MKKPMFVLLTLPMMLLAACSEEKADNAAAPQVASVAAAPAGKQYIVLAEPSYPPFTFRSEKGDMTGLDIDLLNAIAQKEGVNFKFLPHTMTGLWEKLNAGGADIVAGGINITPEREQNFLFSKPYLDGSWVVMLDKNKYKFNTLAELQGKPIAVQLDSLAQSHLKTIGISDNAVVTDTIHLGVNAVDLGEAVGVYDVDSVLNTYVNKDNGHYYTLLDEKSGKISFGWVVKKDNTELQNLLNKGLDDLKADGSYEQILHKWHQK